MILPTNLSLPQTVKWLKKLEKVVPFDDGLIQGTRIEYERQLPPNDPGSDKPSQPTITSKSD